MTAQTTPLITDATVDASGSESEVSSCDNDVETVTRDDGLEWLDVRHHTYVDVSATGDGTGGTARLYGATTEAGGARELRNGDFGPSGNTSLYRADIQGIPFIRLTADESCQLHLSAQAEE